MLTGIEPLLKWTPVAGAILMVAIGYGQLSSDVKNLQSTQSQQFILIEHQLADITLQLETYNAKNNR